MAVLNPPWPGGPRSLENGPNFPKPRFFALFPCHNLCRNGRLLQDLPDDSPRSVTLPFADQASTDDAMRQDGEGQPFYVVGNRELAVFQHGLALHASEEHDRSARTYSQVPAPHECASPQ